MIVAIDVGYSHTKVATDGKREIFPSVLGEVQEAHHDFGLAGDGHIQIKVGDDEWLVGEAAIEQSGLRTRRQDRAWIETPEYLVLLLAAISEISKASRMPVQIVTGLPVAYFGDKDSLKGRLLGEHRLSRNGRGWQKIDVTDVLVLPQGLAAVLSEALTEDGKVKPGPVSKGRVGLVDIGGHTVNVATFQELTEIARQTASIDAGMWGALTEIGKRINVAYPGQELRGHEIVTAVKSGTIRHYGKEYDVTEFVNSVTQRLASQILAEASTVWGDAARLDALLLAGGGAEVVAPAFMARYPHVRVVSDPQWANVAGYLRFGRRHWR